MDNDEKIDVVVPYVDFEDDNWQKLAKENGIEIDINRYRGQGGFFKYFFRGIDRNISWINNIYLLVQSESQVPKWIDKTKLKVVLHEDFIPKEYLPVYSSCTIEMFLHKIPNLSEKFLYFNDDNYVIRELQPTDFFINGKVRQNFFNYFPIGTHGNHSKNGYKIVFNNNGALIPEHSIKPLLKSKIEECFETYKEEILNSISKTREDKNFNVYIYSYYLLKNNLCEKSKVAFKYISSYNYFSYLYLKGCQTLCINDCEEESIYDDTRLNKWFSDYFKEKSKYEL